MIINESKDSWVTSVLAYTLHKTLFILAEQSVFILQVDGFLIVKRNV
jgi:hypothetical protein